MHQQNTLSKLGSVVRLSFVTVSIKKCASVSIIKHSEHCTFFAELFLMRSTWLLNLLSRRRLTWASMSRCLIRVMDFLKVSLSPGIKVSSSSARLQGLVTINWAIWSFRLLRDWTAAKQARKSWVSEKCKWKANENTHQHEHNGQSMISSTAMAKYLQLLLPLFLVGFYGSDLCDVRHFLH